MNIISNHKAVKNIIGILPLAVLLCIVSCKNSSSPKSISNTLQPSSTLIGEDINPILSHSNKTEPNYNIVFAQNKVLRFDIKINASDWDTLQNNLSNLFKNDNHPEPRHDLKPPPDMNHHPMGKDRPRPMGHGMPPEKGEDKNPVWVPCTFTFNGINWQHVGIRYKGNSSLRSAFLNGSKKLSFKLDFDQFEDEYPAQKNQRFYGFKQLNLNNNYDDNSFMREKISSELFKEMDVPSVSTAFCTLYIDCGSGPEYYGLYTLVEEVDDTFVKDYFGNNTGNLYKPDRSAASFSAGNLNTMDLGLKNNNISADYSDVKILHNIINSPESVRNTKAWMNTLEQNFDVDIFCKWLAVNTLMQNWDSYGKRGHNYFLYHNPKSDKLTWIPWDNNESLSNGKEGGAISLSLNDVDDQWPLISHILDQKKYRTLYNKYLETFGKTIFTPSNMIPRYETYRTLLSQYAQNEPQNKDEIKPTSAFNDEVDNLISHVEQRHKDMLKYLQN